MEHPRTLTRQGSNEISNYFGPRVFSGFPLANPSTPDILLIGTADLKQKSSAVIWYISGETCLESQMIQL